MQTCCSSSMLLLSLECFNDFVICFVLASTWVIGSLTKCSSCALWAPALHLSSCHHRQWFGDVLSFLWALHRTRAVPDAYSLRTRCKAAPCCYSCQWLAGRFSSSAATWLICCSLDDPLYSLKKSSTTYLCWRLTMHYCLQLDCHSQLQCLLQTTHSYWTPRHRNQVLLDHGRSRPCRLHAIAKVFESAAATDVAWMMRCLSAILAASEST